MSKIEEQIAELKSKQAKSLSEMDALARRFIAETARHMKARFMDMAKAVGKPQQQVTHDIGEKGMAELIADIKALMSRLDDVCNQHLYKNTVWLHLNWPKEHKYANDSRGEMDGPSETAPDFSLRQHFSYAIADCLDELAVLLNAKGFRTTESRHMQKPHAIHTLVYKQFEWSPQMLQIQREYRDKETVVWQSEREMERQTQQKPYEKTDDLWDTLT